MSVLVSGGFDPLHVGHVCLIQEARRLYGRVFVALNSDQWLMRKKGYVFMPWQERYHVMLNVKGVYKVVTVDDADGTVCDAIARLKPTYFANGGDRDAPNLHESMLCERLGVKQVFGVGGAKIASSSALVARARDREVRHLEYDVDPR